MESKVIIRQAVILAGGAGSRLRPFTLKKPKPLVPLNGKPFIDYLLKLLKENSIKEVVILTGYKGEKISQYLGDGRKQGIKIKYSYTPFKNFRGEEIKSGIRILTAHEFLDDYFLLLYCDNYLPIDLAHLKQFYIKKNCEVMLTVFSNSDSSTKNNVKVNEEGIITKYDKSRTYKGLNGVDAGFMIVNKKVLNYLPEKNVKFEDAIFTRLIKDRRLAGYITEQKYYSIGDNERIKLTAKFLKHKKVIFLDRDGVINKKALKSDYIKNWEEFEFLPGVIEGLKLLCQNGYKIFILSNQAGVARGMMTDEDLKLIHKRMQQVLKEQGITISAIYSCPHGWNDGCFCRKPKPGMLYKASIEHHIDLSKSLFIGDDIRDKQAGEQAGIKTILVTKKRPLIKIVYSLVK